MLQELPPATPLGTTTSRRARQQSATQVVSAASTAAVQAPSTARGYALREEQDWDWEDLRDYVVAQIESRIGMFPRDAVKEAATFKAFANRHGKMSSQIARYAFEVCDGWWHNAPIRVERFCKGSDPYFASKIAERIASTA